MTDESTDLRSQAIANHAKELGFNLDQDQEFLWLAEESLEVPLPLHWQQVVSEDGSGSLFFYNSDTDVSQWAHPLDEEYRTRLQDLRAKRSKKKKRAKIKHRSKQKEHKKEKKKKTDHRHSNSSSSKPKAEMDLSSDDSNHETVPSSTSKKKKKKKDTKEINQKDIKFPGLHLFLEKYKLDGKGVVDALSEILPSSSKDDRRALVADLFDSLELSPKRDTIPTDMLVALLAMDERALSNVVAFDIFQRASTTSGSGMTVNSERLGKYIQQVGVASKDVPSWYSNQGLSMEYSEFLNDLLTSENAKRILEQAALTGIGSTMEYPEFNEEEKEAEPEQVKPEAVKEDQKVETNQTNQMQQKDVQNKTAGEKSSEQEENDIENDFDQVVAFQLEDSDEGDDENEADIEDDGMSASGISEQLNESRTLSSTTAATTTNSDSRVSAMGVVYNRSQQDDQDKEELHTNTDTSEIFTNSNSTTKRRQELSGEKKSGSPAKQNMTAYNQSSQGAQQNNVEQLEHQTISSVQEPVQEFVQEPVQEPVQESKLYKQQEKDIVHLNVENKKILDELKNMKNKVKRQEKEYNALYKTTQQTEQRVAKNTTALHSQISELQDRVMSSEAEARASDMLAETGRRNLREELKKLKNELQISKSSSSSTLTKVTSENKLQLKRAEKELQALEEDHQRLNQDHQTATRAWSIDKENLRIEKIKNEKMETNVLKYQTKFDTISTKHDELFNDKEELKVELVASNKALLSIRKELDSTKEEERRMREYVEDMSTRERETTEREVREWRAAFDKATELATERSLVITRLEREREQVRNEHASNIDGRDILLTELTKRLTSQEDSCMALVEVNSELSRELLLVQETLNLYMSKYEVKTNKEEEGNEEEEEDKEDVNRKNNGTTGNNGDSGDVKSRNEEDDVMQKDDKMTMADVSNNNDTKNDEASEALSMNQITAAMTIRGDVSNDPDVLSIISSELLDLERTTNKKSLEQTPWSKMTAYRSSLRTIFNKYCTASVYMSKTIKNNKTNTTNSTNTTDSTMETKLTDMTVEEGENTDLPTAAATISSTASTTRQRRSLVMVMGLKEFTKWGRDYSISGNIIPHVNFHPLFDRHCHYQASNSNTSSSSKMNTSTGPTTPRNSKEDGGVMFFSEFQSLLLEMAEEAFNDAQMLYDIHSSTTCLGRLLFHIDRSKIGSGNKFKGLTKIIKHEKSLRRPKSSTGKNNNKNSISNSNNINNNNNINNTIINNNSGSVKNNLNNPNARLVQSSTTAASFRPPTKSRRSQANTSKMASRNARSGRSGKIVATRIPGVLQEYSNESNTANASNVSMSMSSMSAMSATTDQRNTEERLASSAGPSGYSNSSFGSNSFITSQGLPPTHHNNTVSSHTRVAGAMTAPRPKRSRSNHTSSNVRLNSRSNDQIMPSSSPADGRGMHSMLSTLFEHYGRRERHGYLSMKTFLRLARASNIVPPTVAASAVATPNGNRNNHHHHRNNNNDSSNEEEEDDEGTITVKRLTSIVERVQRQYGSGTFEIANNYRSQCFGYNLSPY